MSDAEHLVIFANECLYPKRHAHTEIGAMYCAYRVWCSRREIEVLMQEQFADAFASLCKRVGIKVSPLGDLVYVMHTRVLWEIASVPGPPHAVARD